MARRERITVDRLDVLMAQMKELEERLADGEAAWTALVMRKAPKKAAKRTQQSMDSSAEMSVAQKARR